MMVGASLGLGLGLGGLLLEASQSSKTSSIPPELVQRINELSTPCEGSLNSVVAGVKTLLGQNREKIQERIFSLCDMGSIPSCPDDIRKESLRMINAAIGLTVFCPNATVWDQQFTDGAEQRVAALHLHRFTSVYLTPHDTPNTTCGLLGLLVHEAWHDLGYKVADLTHDEGTDWVYETANSVEQYCQEGFESDSQSQ